MWMLIKNPQRRRLPHTSIWLCLIISALLYDSVPAYAQTSPPSRPILFVHGFCGSATDFGPLLGSVYHQLDSSLYPSSTLYYVEYDSVLKATTFTDASGSYIAASSIPSNTRFFSIQLYDPISESTDPNDVAKISILNKAYEISQVIKQITAITHVKDVIIIGHSMGGLDARAYVENMASPTGCYDYLNNAPYYVAPQCAPGSGNAAYQSDVGDIITVDTPHSGSPLANLSFGTLACFSSSSTNKTELELQGSGGKGLIEALNYNDSPIAGVLPLKPNSTPIQAVEDYFSDNTDPWTNSLSTALTGYSDDVVLLQSQSIKLNIPPSDTSASLVDVPISFLSTDAGIAATSACWVGGVLHLPMLHLMPCLGNLQSTEIAIANQIYANESGTLTSVSVQATYNGAPWTGSIRYQLSGPNGYWEPEMDVPLTVSDLALGTYSISNISGGPSRAGVPTVTVSPSPTIQLGQWAATFTINFADKSPSSTTVSASATQVNQGVTVTLTAKVQSTAGTPTGTITFYDNGTIVSSVTLDGSGMGIYSTAALPVGTNSISASYNGDANVSASSSPSTSVTVIGSSLILPAPALTSPPNGGTNQLTTPVFIWSQVPNNSGYRIMVASSLAALPTDPNASSCVPTDSACVIDQAQSLTAGVNYYSVPSGVLLPGKTYYWQVHARASSPYLPGYWSVASFSTSGGMQPPAVITGAAASVATNSATLTGTVNPNGLDTQSYFLFGTNIGLNGAIQTPPQDIGFGNTNSGLNANVSGLTPGTQYYFQLVGSNNSGITKGAINTFTTSDGSQAVLTIKNSVGGAIFSQNGPVQCSSSSTCTYSFSSGTAMTLYAIATPGWLPAWNGCDSVNGSYCTLTMWLSRTVTVTYNQYPAPPITLQPTSLSFTSVTGVQSQVGQVFIINSGSSGLNPLTIAITGTNAANFNETNTCPASGLNAGNECIASVTFTPTSIGIASAFLSVSSSNAASSPMLVPLTGTGTSGNVIAPTVQVTPSLTSITTAQALPVTIAVNGGTGNPIPTGSVTLISGSYTSQPTPLSNGNAMVSVPTGALSVGTDQLTAAYQGDSNYSSQNGTNSVTVTGAQISCSSYSSSTDQITGITQPLRLGFGNGKLVAGGVGQAYIVDPISSQIATIPFPQYAGGIAGKVSVINSQAFIPISNLSQGELAVLSLGTAAVSEYVQVGVEPYGSLLAGNQLYIGDSVLSGNGSPSQVYVINPASGQIATSINAGHGIQSLASDPVHNTIYALNYNDATASVINLGSNSVVATIPLGIMPTSGVVVNDKLLVVGDVPQTQQGKIVEVDTSSNSVEAASLVVGRDPFEIVAVNGCAFVTNLSDSTVSVVDLANNDVVKTISAGIGTNPTGAAVDPSSGRVYIANQVGNSISVLTPGSTSTPTITVTPSATSITTAQSLTVIIAVNGGTGNPAPSGAVTITSGSYTSNATTLSGGSATIVIPAGLLNQGNDTLAVSYAPDSSSSSTYNSAIGAASVLVSSSRTTPSVTVTPSASSITTTQQLTVTVAVNGGTGNPTPTGTVTLTGGGYTSTNAPLSSGSAQVNIPSNSLSVGTDSLAVTYTPDSSSSSIYNSASGSTTVTVTTPAKTTPTVGVTPSSSSITTAQPLTVTVSVSGGTGNPMPTGTVTLSGGGYTSAATILSGGSATINIPANSLSVGTDSLSVSYTPDSSSSSTYNSASGSATVTVTTPAKITPTVTVTPSSNSITTTQPLTVTVSVNGGSGNPTPAGTVRLSGGGYTSAATILSGGSATINIPANSLNTGTDSLAVSYTPDSSSSSTYNSASGSATVTVTTPAKITPTVTVTPSSNSITTTQPLTVTVSVNGGSGNPTPTGTVTLSGGGYISAASILSGGSATINIPANSLSVGTDSLSVSYTPDSSSSSTYNSASGSATVTVTTPAKITPTVTVTPSSNSITTTQPLTVTVSVNGGSGNPTPTGTGTLSGGGYSSQQTLSAGTANFSIAAETLANGANTLTASYSGDSTYTAANSTSTVVVEPVSVSATSPPQVNPGHSTSSTVTLTGSHGYSGTMKLICSLKSSPAGAQSLPSCGMNPTNVVLPVDGNGTSTLTVNTTAASTTASAHPTDRYLWKMGGGALLAALLFLGGIPSQRRRWWPWMLLLLIAMTGAIACGGGGGTSGNGGGGGSGTPATTAGTYSFAVTATDSVDANITVSTTVSVTVQ